ncbi:MAG: hypothetical protein H0T68_07145 [Gemmatimonadales bacterium]|nr:hypothetical protein [Gemmatimonadales bacterium]
MNRMKSMALAAAVGSAALAGVPAAAQERARERYSVADNVLRERDAESRVRIPSGTNIAVTLDEDIPIDRDRIGDSFDAHVNRDVVVRGKVAIPAGAPAKVRLVESSEKSNAAAVRLSELRVNGKMRDVAVGDARADTDQRDRDTGKKTAVGAAAGAIVGAVTGAGILEGAVIGAGGGLAWGLLSGGGREIGDDTTLQFELEEELEVK